MYHICLCSIKSSSILVCFYSPELEVQLLMCLWFWWRGLYCWTWNQITHRQNIFMSPPNMYKHIQNSNSFHQQLIVSSDLQSANFKVLEWPFFFESYWSISVLPSLCMSGARLVLWEKVMTCSTDKVRSFSWQCHIMAIMMSLKWFISFIYGLSYLLEIGTLVWA